MNLDKIYQEINIKLEKIIDKVTDKTLELLKETITEEIYEPRKPEKYQRTFDFRDRAWVKTKVQTIGFGLINGQLNSTTSGVWQMIYFDGKKMSYSPSKYIHGTQGYDRRTKMAYILSDPIENEYESEFWGALNVQWARGYNYWTAFLVNWHDEIIKWFEQEAKKEGLQLTKI